MTRLGIHVLVCIACAACGERPERDTTGATLVIEPATSELLILNGEPAHQTYTATLVFPDGTEEDATADTVFSIDTAFGSFDGRPRRSPPPASCRSSARAS